MCSHRLLPGASTRPASPREGGGPAPLEETQALFIYLSVYPATHLFISNSNIISLGRHQEGKKKKKSEIDTRSLSSGEPAACSPGREGREGGGFLISFQRAGARGCCGGFPEVPLRTSPPPPSSTASGRLRAASTPQGRAAVENTRVLQSIDLVAGSIGRAGQAGWLGFCSGRPHGLGHRGPGSNPELYHQGLGDLGHRQW